MTRAQWGYLHLVLWLLAITLVIWTLRQLPLDDILPRLTLLSWQHWSIWLLLNITVLYLAVKRWQLLGRALAAPMSLMALFRLRQAGSAVSFLTPGPHFGGEPLQLYWLHRHYRLPLHRAIAKLGLDRFMETGVNVAVLLSGVLLLLGATLLPVGESLRIGAILAALLMAMLLTARAVLRHPAWLAERFRPLAQRWGSETGRARSERGWLALVASLRHALQRQRSRIWLALLLSLLGWAAIVLELSLLLHLLGISLSPTELVLILVGIRLAMLLPVPGGLGTVEASLLWSFHLLGLPASAAAGLIALSRLRDAAILVVGLACLASLRRADKQAAAP